MPGDSTAVAPNGNTTTSTYDALARLLTKVTGTRAAYAMTYNRAGTRLKESSTITGDPANGTATTNQHDHACTRNRTCAGGRQS